MRQDCGCHGNYEPQGFTQSYLCRIHVSSRTVTQPNVAFLQCLAIAIKVKRFFASIIVRLVKLIQTRREKTVLSRFSTQRILHSCPSSSFASGPPCPNCCVSFPSLLFTTCLMILVLCLMEALTDRISVTRPAWA